MTASTATTVQNLRNVAVRAYIQNGESIDAAWSAIRARLRHLRAPSPVEQIARNGSRRRTYRSPIGSALVIPGASGEYGSHAANWPRTVRSISERQSIATVIRNWFDAESSAL